jgi:hypothetical protein
MSRRRTPRLFRVAALLASLAMLLAWTEVVVPDVHDGHRSGGGAASSQLARDDGPAPSDTPGHAPQAPHTCHCIHAHVAAIPAARQAQPAAPPASPRFSAADVMLASIAPEPHFRPPVA